ncbi:MAG: heavy-metal-associated domain-containing protein [Erysipelotrichaceae bacterium]|nr:heavy-metal-associated domain-containing protein [Erysipelotrichaceae bacterium]MBR2791664.1 heavy-metal-associated domain-containing protein [Erysipelotrichaceae bacterium]
MNKITLKIEGMACNMCEAHMNETVRRAIPKASKVSSSFRKGETVFLSDEPVDEEMLRKAISETGYEMKSMTVEPYERKGLFGILR